MNDLASRAQSGDRVALERLAVAVWRLAHAHAHRIAKKYAGTDADDLGAEGMATLQAAVEHWDFTKGSFGNYFTYCATRRMTRYARKLAARTAPRITADPPACSCGDTQAVDAAADVARILDTLPAPERLALCLRFGLGGHNPHPLSEMGRAMGIPRDTALALVRAAMDLFREAYPGAEFPHAA